MDDLRSYLARLRDDFPREFLQVDDALSADWELAACTAGFEQRMRVATTLYTNVKGTDFPVVHNVCSSLARIARSMGCTVDELEGRLAHAYDDLIPAETVASGPVQEVVYRDEAVNLAILPSLRYTESETHAYLSAACVVARDASSNSLNISYHRLMISDENTLVIYMTPGGDLDTIFRRQQALGQDTAIAVFIGAHPLWSLGSLAAGPLSLDEYAVIGGLLGAPLPVVACEHDSTLLVPASAEFALEGFISGNHKRAEGPYGEAFGYVSAVDEQPSVRVTRLSHRQNAIFQDIVPGRIEHMTMTSTAIRVHLEKSLREHFPCVGRIHLPAPMTVFVSVAFGTSAGEIASMITASLQEQRFVKLMVVFDDDVTLDNSRQTQLAQALHVQHDRDVVVVAGCPGNGLDPSEESGTTCKWGIDASSSYLLGNPVRKNELPKTVVSELDVADVLSRAMAEQKART